MSDRTLARLVVISLMVFWVALGWYLVAHATVKPMSAADQALYPPCPSVCASTGLPPAVGKVCTPLQMPQGCIGGVTVNPTAKATP